MISSYSSIILGESESTIYRRRIYDIFFFLLQTSNRSRIYSEDLRREVNCCRLVVSHTHNYKEQITSNNFAIDFQGPSGLHISTRLSSPSQGGHKYYLVDTALGLQLSLSLHLSCCCRYASVRVCLFLRAWSSCCVAGVVCTAWLHIPKAHLQDEFRGEATDNNSDLCLWGEVGHRCAYFGVDVRSNSERLVGISRLFLGEGESKTHRERENSAAGRETQSNPTPHRGVQPCSLRLDTAIRGGSWFMNNHSILLLRGDNNTCMQSRCTIRYADSVRLHATRGSCAHCKK